MSHFVQMGGCVWRFGHAFLLIPILLKDWSCRFASFGQINEASFEQSKDARQKSCLGGDNAALNPCVVILEFSVVWAAQSTMLDRRVAQFRRGASFAQIGHV
mmetsp:Transcript_49369/g.159355  ORF Transcript_49369/g.159355 Transcript_49369/m.159355 type:complete len:102 (+) Transcript_49369:112-417(+)